MTKILSLKKEYIAYGAVLLFGLLMSAMAANASSTISTTISTDASLAVGTSATIGTTLTISGATNMATASSTGLVKVHTLTVGTGDTVTKVLTGTCSLVSNTSIAATSTGTGTCATTGSVAGDQVFVSLATTSTVMTGRQWVIIGTVAGTDSTTVRLLNLTGADQVPSATNSFGSSTQYWVVRD